MKKQLIFYFNITTSLILGLLIYLIYRPESIITHLFLKMNVDLVKPSDISLFSKFLCNYGGDILWAYALSFFVAYFYIENANGWKKTLFLCILIEVCFELLQLFNNIINWTFDIIDIIFEIATSIIIVFLLDFTKDSPKI